MKKTFISVAGINYPAEILDDNVLRFRRNRIVDDLHEKERARNPSHMTDIADAIHNGWYNQEERKEYYRLIGYSACGYDEIFGTNSKESQPEPEQKAGISVAQHMLLAMTEALITLQELALAGHNNADDVKRFRAKLQDILRTSERMIR